MATIAALIVDVAANTASIDKSTRQINQQLDAISGMAGKMGKALAGAFTIKAVVDAGKQVIDYAGKVTDLAARLDVSTTAIQEWEAAFGPAGVSIETVAKASTELAAKIVGGDKSAVAALQKMGFSLKELTSLSPEQQFNKVADAVGRLQNQGEKIYASKTLFGKGGTELLQALDGHLQENIKSFNDLGLIIDEQTIKAADDFGDQLGMLGKQLLGVVAHIVGPLLPALSALGNVLSWLGRNVVGPVLGGAIKVAMTLLAGFVEVVTGLLSRLASLGSNLPMVGDKFKQMAGALDDVSKKSGAYMVDLWQQKDATESTGSAAAAATPKLLGLGAASEAAAKAAKAADEALKESETRILAFGAAASTAAQTIGANIAPVLLEMQRFREALRGGYDPRTALVSGWSETSAAVLHATELVSDFTLQMNRAKEVEASIAQAGSSGIERVGVQIRMAGQQASGFLNMLRGIPQLLVSALTGGGGVRGAAQAVASQFGSHFGERLGRSISALGSLGGPIGAAIGSLAGPLVGMIGRLFSNPEKQVNPVRQAFIDAAGGLAVLNQRAAVAGVTLREVLDAKTPEQYRAAIERLNAALEFQDQAMQTLDETVQRYGFTIEELGPAFARQRLEDRAGQLYQDFQVLTTSGINVDTVLGRMGDSINEFVHDALRTGTEIPAAMAPMLQRMVEMGTLTDASGAVITDLEGAGVRFAMTMSEGFRAIVDEVKKLTDAIARGLGLAIQNIPNPEIEGTVRWHVEPVPGSDFPRETEVIPMAEGGIGRAIGPTLFYSRGQEDFAFSGEGQRFSRGGDRSATVIDLASVRAELAALRQQQAEQQQYFTGQFARDLARAVRDKRQLTLAGSR